MRALNLPEARRRFFPESGVDSDRMRWRLCRVRRRLAHHANIRLGIIRRTEAPKLSIPSSASFAIIKAPVFHEVSPHAGVDALNLLCERGYRPIEISNVLYRSVERPAH